MKKRVFLKKLAGSSAGLTLMSSVPTIFTACGKPAREESQEAEADEVVIAPWNFDISLAQWSLHKTLFAKELENLDFAAVAKNDLGISAVEYVNQFFKDKAKDEAYLGDMKMRTDDLGVENVLIMVDGEGHIGSTEDEEQTKAVENHYKWVEAAKFLGCHSIRVNAAGNGTAKEVSAAAIEGLGKLATFAKDTEINVIVENHGGHSSDGKWLSNVISQVNMDNCGTLPDFGNFCVRKEDPEDLASPCAEEYDRYQGVKDLMPYARGVSAKSNNFDENGDEIDTDFVKMMQIVKDAGYSGYVGIEYEGGELSEIDGIKATKVLLEKVREQLKS